MKKELEASEDTSILLLEYIEEPFVFRVLKNGKEEILCLKDILTEKDLIDFRKGKQVEIMIFKKLELSNFKPKMIDENEISGCLDMENFIISYKFLVELE